MTKRVFEELSFLGDEFSVMFFRRTDAGCSVDRGRFNGPWSRRIDFIDEGEMTTRSHADSTNLIADNSLPTCMQIREFLKECGFEVLFAGDQEECFGVLVKTRPDAILLDGISSEVEGIEIYRRIKSAHPLHEIPVLKLTCATEVENKAKGHNADAEECITKPFEVAELMAYDNSASQLGDSPQSESGRILVVDDSVTTRKILTRGLKEQGYRVSQAENGRQALEMVRSEPFDLVLLDVIMPEMDGYQVLQNLKEHDVWRDIPVIMISAVDQMSSVVRCIEMGAEDYLPKTFDPVLLKARIGACLEKKRLRDSEVEQQKKLNELNRALQVRNRFIRETFGRYLSDEIVESLLETPAGLKLGGEKRTLTILIADLRGFTSMSEKLPPEDVVNIINIYLETMTEIIYRYKGTIDEFIGDAILAIFGAPLQREDDARRAVACAVEMQQAMAGVNERCRRAGYPETTMGIGINTGEVVVGNIGGKMRTKYGVVGLNVNLTSRIESCTVGGQILISETTLEACGPILRIDDRAEVMLKGVSRPIVIYDVGGIDGEYGLHLPLGATPRSHRWQFIDTAV